MNIAFYFPYPSVGGVSILFLRYAQLLSTRHNVIIMDLDDGYMAQNVPQGCSFLSYDKLDELPEDTILVTQSCPLWRIPYLENAPRSTKLFYWNLHPDNLSPLIHVKGGCIARAVRKGINGLASFRKRKLQALLADLVDTNGIAFMDGENCSQTERWLGMSIPGPVYCPITNQTEASDTNLFSPKGLEKSVRVISIGRTEGFKTSIILHLIERLDAIQTHNIHLTLVGSGADVELVKSALNKTTKLTFEHIEEIHYSEIPHLVQKQHLSFAMGTSALDSASIGIPTIGLDFSNEPITGLYRFRYLFDAKLYNVGCNIDGPDFFEQEDTLTSLIDELCVNGPNISNKTMNYYQSHHSVEVVERLEHALKHNCTSLAKLLDKGYHRADIVTSVMMALMNKNKIDDSGLVKY